MKANPNQINTTPNNSLTYVMIISKDNTSIQFIFVPRDPDYLHLKASRINVANEDGIFNSFPVKRKKVRLRIK